MSDAHPLRGKAYGHGGAPTGPVACHGYRAPVRFYYGAGDGQSQPCAAYSAIAGLVGAVESVEDVGHIRRVHADTVIGNRHDQLIVAFQRRPERNAPARIRRMDGVANDVSQRLAHPHPVEVHVREVGGYFQRQFDLSRLGLWLPALRLHAEKIADRHGFEREAQFAAVGLRKPVQIGYETAEPVHFLDDVVGRALRGLEPVPQPVRLQPYDGQRGIQLMRDVVYQPAAELALGLQVGGHTVERRAHPSQLVRGRNRQTGRIPLGNRLCRLRQRGHRRP